jgi:hypothetical protein
MTDVTRERSVCVGRNHGCEINSFLTSWMREKQKAESIV